MPYCAYLYLYFKVFILLSISPLYNVVSSYVNTIFVPNLEPVSFVSIYDTMYFILFTLYCIVYMFLLTHSVSGIVLFMDLRNI